MKYLHTMVRADDIEQSLRFYRDALGLIELSRKDYPQGRYTLVFLAAPGDEHAQVELTTTGIRRAMGPAATSATSPMPWRTSTPRASG